MAGNGSIGSSENELAVRVEDVAGMTVEIVTLACAGDCADLAAVVHGGHSPYAFAWAPLATASWQTYYATLTPTQDAAYLALVPIVASGQGVAYVDHLVPVATCP